MTRDEIKRPYFKLQSDMSLRGYWLRQDEAIHHIDGNPRNNDLQNLRVVKLNQQPRHHQSKY